jgi:hypothetical protein
MEETTKQQLKPSLTEQAKFLEGAIKTLLNQKNAAIEYDAKDVDMLKAIAENINTVRSWILLPDYHQAAMRILDEAYRAEVLIKSEGLQFPAAFDVLVYLLSRLRKLNNGTSRSENEEMLLITSSIALIGVAKFIIPRTKEVTNG